MQNFFRSAQGPSVSDPRVTRFLNQSNSFYAGLGRNGLIGAGAIAVGGLALGGANYLSNSLASDSISNPVGETNARLGTTAAGLGVVGGLGYGAYKLFEKSAPYGVQHRFGSGAVRLLSSMGRTAVEVAKGAEKFAIRPLLTGMGNSGKSAMDAYFPFMNKVAGKGEGAIQRFALNPKGVRNLAGIAVLAAVGKVASTPLYNPAPPASVYHDGVTSRHIDDMGASPSLAQKTMGSSSSFNR